METSAATWSWSTRWRRRYFLSLAWYEDCAYVNGSDGTTVIHVAADGTPTVTKTLTQVGFRSNWESMKAIADERALGGLRVQRRQLGVFDVAGDCTDPVHRAPRARRRSIGHAGSFSPDGTIYYALVHVTASIYAVDLADPAKPDRAHADFDGMSAHDLVHRQEGNRGYFAYPGPASDFGQGSLRSWI